MSCLSPLPRRAAGFSLVECLVVVAITAILLAVMMPVLGQTRRTARAVQCLAALRQLTAATQMYQHEARGAFPRPSINNSPPTGLLTDAQQERALWYNALDGHLGEHGEPVSQPAMRRHTNAKQDPAWDRLDDGAKPGNRTLKMNRHFRDDDAGRPFTLGRHVRQPARTVLFVDGRALDIAGVHPIQASLFEATEGVVGLRHQQGANVGFPDGHAGHVTQDVNAGLTVPGWYTEATGRQELVWALD